MIKVQGIAEQGGINILTAGSTSVTEAVGSYPGCTITVYLAGTVTLATIASDAIGTPKANPFTASSSDASWSFYVAPGSYDIRFSGTGIAAPFTLGSVPVADFMPNFFNVKNYGAIGNNTANDTAAIQATIDACDAAGGGTVYLPTGTYKITATLNVGASSNFHYVNLIGAAEISTAISWAGATNSIAVKLNNSKFTQIKNLTITNAVAKGTTEGVRATGTAAGTSTNGLLVENVLISSFHYGWRTSDGSGHTSSEVSFINLTLSNNDTGFLNDDFNGLNFNFLNLIMSSNTIGVDMETSGAFVYGGSASANGTDFKFLNDGTNTIIGFRSETIGTRFVNFASAAGSNKLSIIGCMALMASSPNTSTAISASGGKIHIQDSNIGGQISISSGSSVISLQLHNNAIIDPSNTFTAIANPTLMGPGFRIADGGSGGQFESSGNIQYSGDFNTIVAAWPNARGVFYDSTGIGPTRAVVTNGIHRGSDVASTNVIFPTGPFFHVTGTSGITDVNVGNLPIGTRITIVFDGALTMVDGSNLKLAGNFVTTANDSITLINDDGTNWLELSRSTN